MRWLLAVAALAAGALLFVEGRLASRVVGILVCVVAVLLAPVGPLS
ncbi:MAG: hypothetical protein J0H06_03040 [Actinobacteria bacterium]|nr:hypothetical protein [Actinomycetota bacterium]